MSLPFDQKPECKTDFGKSDDSKKTSAEHSKECGIWKRKGIHIVQQLSRSANDEPDTDDTGKAAGTQHQNTQQHQMQSKEHLPNPNNCSVHFHKQAS